MPLHACSTGSVASGTWASPASCADSISGSCHGKKAVQFDAAEPWWFTFGGLIGAMLGLALAWIPRLFDGTPRLLVLAVVVGLLVAYVLKVKTWRQQHRVPKAH